MAKPANRKKTGPERGPDGRWRKGASGNLSGRPKLAPEIREIAREAGPRALERAMELVEHDDPGVALRACALVLDRAYGRPAQPLVGSDEGSNQIEERRFDDRELARRIALLLSRADPRNRKE